MPRLILIACLFLSSAAWAEAPRVATDIAPVHSLVSRVMQGVGAPDLVVTPGASPHGYALRPSQAAALNRADAVFVVGHALTPWLDGALTQLASGAVVVELMETEGTVLRPFRDSVAFAAPNGQDDHDDAHDHHGDDPHAWLDPENARAWLRVIAEELAALDPENATIYRDNAETARTDLTALSGAIAADLAPLTDRPFVTFHDAFQYYELRFGLNSAGAITLGDATAPSAARIARIRETIATRGVTCVFSEPQFNPGLVETVLSGTGATTAVIDPLGTDLPLGPTLYPDLLRQITRSVMDCL